MFRRLRGHLVIVEKLLNIRDEYDEGGVIDLVVGPRSSRGPAAG